MEGALTREFTNADEPFGLENANDGAKMFVASGKKRVPFARRQFIRCPIAATFFDERERAIINDKMMPEKFFGGAKTLRKKFP